MATPDITYLLYGLSDQRDDGTSTKLQVCCWISYAISNLVDGYIYILLQADVKKLLMKKMSKCWCCRKGTKEVYSVNRYGAYDSLNGVVVITTISDRYHTVQKCVTKL